MTRRRRVVVGLLLCAAVAALALATYFSQSAMSVAMGIVCVLTLAWAYILVSDHRGSR